MRLTRPEPEDSHMNHHRNLGLGVRMVLALLALGVLYIVMGYSIALLFGAFVGPTGFGHLIGIAVTILLLAGGQYYYGADLALRLMDAQIVEREEYPELHDQVQFLAQQAGVATPRVAVANNQTPNAFATGRKQSSAVICATQGLLDELDDDELEAVLAHELSHIVNRDFALMTVVTALAALSGWVVRWGFLFGDGGGDGGNWHMIAGYVAAVGVWIGGFLVGRILSRYREYAADRGAALLTGKPLALASALRTISDETGDVPEEDLREAEQINALLAAEIRESRLSKFARTHPAVENRIEKLEEMATDMESGR